MSDRAWDPSDPFARFRAYTSARIGMGRSGQGLPTQHLLEFQLAHARARDAVHSLINVDRLGQKLHGKNVVIQSSAGSRFNFLKNPNAGRLLADESNLPAGTYELVIVLADGLSAVAIERHGWQVANALKKALSDWSCAPFVTAVQARVAIGDPIGAHFGASLVIVLIGERPGLTAADSVGAYLTWRPKSGRMDSERNCVSNIRTPGGLEPELAAANIAWLARRARELGVTGVTLKDQFGDNLLGSGHSAKIGPAFERD